MNRRCPDWANQRSAVCVVTFHLLPSTFHLKKVVLHMTRKWKIINSLIAWLIFFSLVQPAYGAWDTLTAEVTFTAQTGVWNTNPTPTPTTETNEDQPAAASAAPQPSDTPRILK